MERKRTPPTSALKIVQNFYSKVAHVLAWARQDQTHDTNHPSSSHKQSASQQRRVNKWFNLELEELDAFRENLRYWRSAIASKEPPPPLVIELYLDISELSQQQQVLVLVDENQKRNRVETGWISPSSNGGRQSPASRGFQQKKSILLESWQLTLSHPLPDPPPELPVVYKKCIVFFRSLYSYALLLPSYRLFRKIRARHRTNVLKMGCRLSTFPTFRDDEIGIDVPLTNLETRSTTSAHRFSPIETPLGTLELSVITRTHCDFQIDDAEAIMSSRFIDMDENYFTPTMAKEQQQLVHDQRVQQTRSEQAEEEERKRIRTTQRASSISGTLRNSHQPDHSQQPPQLRRFSTFSDHSGSPLYNSKHLQANYPTSITPDQQSQPRSGSASAASSYGPVPVFFPEYVKQENSPDAANLTRSAGTSQRVYSKTLGGYNQQSASVPFGTSPPPFSTRNVNVAQRSAGSEREAPASVLTSGSPPIRLIATGTSPSSPSEHPGSLVRRPSVTFISPFKSPPLSSSASPRSSTDFFPSSSSFSPKHAYSSSSLLRSNSITSIESQTNPTHPPLIRSRPTSIANPIRLGTTPPSIASSHTSVRSVGVTGSPGPSKLSSSFGYRYASPNATAQERGRTSKTSTKSDDGSESGSARQRGSSSSSFFASQTEHDGLTDFVKMIDTRKQLKMFAKKELEVSAPIEQSEYPSGDEPIGTQEGSARMHTSVQKSKLALSRFHQLQAYNNKISDSLSSSMMLAQSPIEEEGQIRSTSPRIPSSSSSSPSSSASFNSKSNTQSHAQRTSKNPTSSLSTIPSSSSSTSSSASLPSPFDSNGPVPVSIPSSAAPRPAHERRRSPGAQKSLGEDRKENGGVGRQSKENPSLKTSMEGSSGGENDQSRTLDNFDAIPDEEEREGDRGGGNDADRGRARGENDKYSEREIRFSSSTKPPPSTTTRLQHYRRSTSPVLSPSYRTRLAGPTHPLGSVSQSRTERRRGSTGSSDSFSGIPGTKSLEEDDEVLLFTMSELSTGGGSEGSSASVSAYASPTAPFGTHPRSADGPNRVRAKFGVKQTPW